MMIGRVVCAAGIWLGLVSCGVPEGGRIPREHTDSLPPSGAVISKEKLSPGINTEDWSATQSQAAWKDHEAERNIHAIPLW